MLMQPTTLVLGAGASVDFQFPLGGALRSEITDMLTATVRGDGTRSLKDVDFLSVVGQKITDGTAALDACARLASALPAFRSIDDCLSTHADTQCLKAVGKLAIAWKIALYEKKSGLSRAVTPSPIGSSEDVIRNCLESTWFGQLFSMLVTGITSANANTVFNKLTVVNFNYDRSFYQLLFHALKRAFDLSTTDASEIMRSLKSYHPYGSLGPLRFGDAGPGVAWAPNSQLRLDAADKLRVYTEGIETTSPELVAMRDALAKSDKIIFLGFGFHKQNVDLLSVKEQAVQAGQWQQIYTTLTHEAKPNQEKIIQTIIDAFNTTPRRIRQGNDEQECVHYLRDFYRLITG